jgi:hypothetical protein
MALVKGIMALIRTRDVDGAGTDAGIYIGVGGREFHADSSADDFERGSKAAYIFGEVTEDTAPYDRRTVNRPEDNDPRGPYHLYTENLDLTPVYVRWEHGGNSADWCLDEISVWAFTGTLSIGYFPAAAPSGLWFGFGTTDTLYLPLKLVTGGRPSMSFDDAVKNFRDQLTAVA